MGGNRRALIYICSCSRLLFCVFPIFYQRCCLRLPLVVLLMDYDDDDFLTVLHYRHYSDSSSDQGFFGFGHSDKEFGRGK